MLDITNGVAEAQAGATHGLIAPDAAQADSPTREESGFGLLRTAKGAVAVQYVEFDVAVAASVDESGKAAIGVVALGLGANLDTRAVNSLTSRVRFRVPLVLPVKA